MRLKNIRKGFRGWLSGGRLARPTSPRPKARLSLESLEARLAPVVGALAFPAPVQPGTGFDGVVRLVHKHQFGPDTACSGSLLTTGRHILTAAHCVDEDVISTTAEFHMPGLAAPIRMVVARTDIHPAWTEDVHAGNDLAILTLDTLAPSGPAGAERYEIFRGNNEIGQTFTLVGYGLTGVGADGRQLNTDGIKRSGLNRWDSDANLLRGAPLSIAAPAAGIALAYDFDDGTAAHDAFGRGYNIANLGQGAAEVMQSQGDSGGPAFIGRAISGVVSFSRQRFNGPDVNGGGDNSFGEFAIMTRVSAFAGHIDDTVAGPHELILDMNFQTKGNDGTADAVLARRNGANIELLINGQLAHSEAAADVTALRILGSADDDNITVAGDLGVGVTVAGRGGKDTLLVTGTENSDSVTVTATSVVVGNQTISYGGVEELNVETRGSVDTINVQSTASGVSTSINAGAGADTVIVSGTNKDLDDIAGALHIKGDRDIDKVVINDQANVALAVTQVFYTDQGLTRIAASAVQGANGQTVAVPRTAGITFDALEEVEYNGANAGNVFFVQSTKPPPRRTTLNGGTGGDTFLVGGNVNKMDDVKGDLELNGLGGTDALTFIDALGASRAYTLTGTTLEREAGKGKVTFGTMESLSLITGALGSTVNVVSTRAATPVTIQLTGAAGIENTVQISPAARNLDSIKGAVEVKGSAGQDKLLVFDEGHVAPTAAALGLPPGSVVVQMLQTTDTFTDRGVTSVGNALVRLANGSTTAAASRNVSISHDAAVNSLTFTSGGAASVQPHLVLVKSTAAGTALTVSGAGATDLFTVGTAQRGLDDIKGAVTVNGLGGADQLTLEDKAGASATGRNYVLQANAVVAAAASTIGFGTMEGVVINASDRGDTLRVESHPPAATPVAFKGNGGLDRLIGADAANVFTVSDNDKGNLKSAGATVSFDSVENLDGGSSADRFVFANGKGVSGKIDGKAGRDTLDYAAYTTGVTVDLARNKATGVFAAADGGVGGVENVFGGSARDVLAGDAGHNVLVGNGGDDDLSGGRGRDLLIGGAGKDALVANDDGFDNHRDGPILIGGRTSFDANDAALEAVMAEWTSARAFDLRVANLLGTGTGPRANGSTFLKGPGVGQTVFADGLADTLTRDVDAAFLFADALDVLTRAARAQDRLVRV